MPSEPTPTTSCWRCQQPPMVTTGDFRDEWCVYCGAYQDPDWRVGGAAPSATTTDAPTDALAAIRARHERDERLTRWVRPDEMHADRAALLAEVERLTRQAESWATVVRQSQDGWDEALRERDALAARLRGGATAPTPDPTAAERNGEFRGVMKGLEEALDLVESYGHAPRNPVPMIATKLRAILTTMRERRRDIGGSHG